MNFMAEPSNLLRLYCQRDARLINWAERLILIGDVGVRTPLAGVYSLLHFFAAIRGKLPSVLVEGARASRRSKSLNPGAYRTDLCP